VNRWLLHARWWALGIPAGLLVAVPFALITRAYDVAWPAVLAETAVFVAVCGPALGLILRRQFDRMLAGVGDGPEDLRARVASRPTLFGRIPQDPAERAATIRLIEHQISDLRRRQPRTQAVGIALVGVAAWLAEGGSPWLWLVAAFWFVVVALSLTLPWLLGRRAELLRASEG